jgi:asparagine synthase (glutamine-hydrolysing)
VCGICGILGFRGDTAAKPDIQTLTAALTHRGPDGEGMWLDGSAGLGHRRLSILDLSETGGQPMSWGDGRFLISYNGEVYNFLEVRAELESRGARFRGNSDTEVVLAAYAEWGPESLRKFNGMWAFAIWDTLRQEMFVARDRFGVKPLFFFLNDRRFVFASEIKALAELDDCPRKPDLSLVRDALFGRSLDRGRATILEGVSRLEPGHWLRVTPDGRVVTHRWWNTWEERVQVPSQAENQVAEFRGLFEDACRIRQRSDVPVCTLLSGGLDSSSIACTVSRVRRRANDARPGTRMAVDWQRSFTSSLPGSAFDETAYAQAVVDACDLQSTLVSADASDLVGQIAAATHVLDSPIVSSMPSVSAVYAAVHQAGLKVTLDGQGADELLSGYGAADVVRYYAARGQLARAWEAADCAGALRWPRVTPGEVLLQESLALIRGRFPVRTTLRKALGLTQAPAALMRGVPGPALPRLSDESELPQLPGANPVTTRLYREFHDNTLPQILRHYDHMAMRWSVESRMPFLDWRLVTYAFSLPVEQLVARGYTKYVLRQAMAGSVPREVLQRRGKLGFPIAYEWFDRADVRNSIRDVLYDSSFEQSGFWEADAVRTWFDRRTLAPWTYEESSLLVRILSTQFWYARFIS